MLKQNIQPVSQTRFGQATGIPDASQMQYLGGSPNFNEATGSQSIGSPAWQPTQQQDIQLTNPMQYAPDAKAAVQPPVIGAPQAPQPSYGGGVGGPAESAYYQNMIKQQTQQPQPGGMGGGYNGPPPVMQAQPMPMPSYNPGQRNQFSLGPFQPPQRDLGARRDMRQQGFQNWEKFRNHMNPQQQGPTPDPNYMSYGGRRPQPAPTWQHPDPTQNAQTGGLDPMPGIDPGQLNWAGGSPNFDESNPYGSIGDRPRLDGNPLPSNPNTNPGGTGAKGGPGGTNQPPGSSMVGGGNGLDGFGDFNIGRYGGTGSGSGTGGGAKGG